MPTISPVIFDVNRTADSQPKKIIRVVTTVPIQSINPNTNTTTEIPVPTVGQDFPPPNGLL